MDNWFVRQICSCCLWWVIIGNSALFCSSSDVTTRPSNYFSTASAYASNKHYLFNTSSIFFYRYARNYPLSSVEVGEYSRTSFDSDFSFSFSLGLSISFMSFLRCDLGLLKASVCGSWGSGDCSATTCCCYCCLAFLFFFLFFLFFFLFYGYYYSGRGTWIASRFSVVSSESGTRSKSRSAVFWRLSTKY